MAKDSFRKIHLVAHIHYCYYKYIFCTNLFCEYIFMDDIGNRGGSSGGDGSESIQKKSHYQRHSAQQIQRLEGYH